MYRASIAKVNIDYISYFICGLLILPLLLQLLASLDFFPTQYVSYCLYGILWLSFFLHIFRNINMFVYRSFLVLIFALFVCLMELFVFPDNRMYIFDTDLFSVVAFLPTNLFWSIIFVIPGLLVADYDNFILVLHSFARIGIVVGALAYISILIQGGELHYDDMTFSYTLCIMVCALIAKTQKYDFYFILLACACMFVAGTRGPILCTICAVLLSMLLNFKSKRTFVYIVIGIIAIVLVQLNLIGIIVNGIGEYLTKFGITELRILDYFNEGNMLDSSGRDTLQGTVISAIMSRPFRGWGIGSDRMLLDGSYVHNIFLEVLCSFGLIFGGAFLCFLAIVSLRALFSKNKSLSLIAFVFITSIVLKLVFSLSIINCREFSIFLGICLGGILKERKERKVFTSIDYKT